MKSTEYKKVFPILGVILIILGEQVLSIYQYIWFQYENMLLNSLVILGIILLFNTVIKFIIKDNNYYLERYSLKERVLLVNTVIIGIVLVKFVLFRNISNDDVLMVSENNNVVINLLITSKTAPLMVCLVGPIIEEMYFRKYFMNIFSYYSGGNTLTLASALFSAVFFGISHYTYGDSLYYLLIITIIGLFFSFSYYTYQDITLCILLHVIYNTANYLTL